MHLRPRTNTLSCVARIRSQLSYATHKFFQEKGFAYVHTPIVTASDCEGAGEMFQVCGLLQWLCIVSFANYLSTGMLLRIAQCLYVGYAC
jgi:aspartyl/asparaginyl-tRNA synthetase